MNKRLMLESIINHYTNGNKTRFAEMLGVKPQTINSWLIRESFDTELIYSKCKGLSSKWLLTGDGEMLTTKTPSTLLHDVDNSNIAINGSVDASTSHHYNAHNDGDDRSIHNYYADIIERLHIMIDKLIIANDKLMEKLHVHIETADQRHKSLLDKYDEMNDLHKKHFNDTEKGFHSVKKECKTVSKQQMEDAFKATLHVGG